MKRYRHSSSLVVALILLLAGCGDVTVGGMDGEVRSVATGDGGAQSSSAAAGYLQPAVVSAAPSGTVSFAAQITLIRQMGEPVPLNAAPVSATVRIEGTDLAPLAERRVPVGEYSHVRVVFSSITANVEGGLLVNGTPFLGQLSVALGTGGTTTVEAPVQLVVERTFRSTVLIDLRSSAWLPATDLLTRTVPAATFRSAVQVRVQ